MGTKGWDEDVSGRMKMISISCQAGLIAAASRFVFDGVVWGHNSVVKWTFLAVSAGGTPTVFGARSDVPSGIDVTCHGDSSWLPLGVLLVGDLRSDGVRVTVTTWAVPFVFFRLVVETFLVTAFPPEKEVSCRMEKQMFQGHLVSINLSSRYEGINIRFALILNPNMVDTKSNDPHMVKYTRILSITFVNVMF